MVSPTYPTRPVSLTMLTAMVLLACQPAYGQQAMTENWPQAQSPAAITDPEQEAFIGALLARMNVEEKVGQIIQADIASITPADLATYPLGSILAGGGSAPGGNERAPAADWVKLAREFRAAALARPGAQVPVVFGIDAVHGQSNIPGATLFPHNIGLGAARDPDLIRRIGVATAREVAATGQEWTFAPTLAVPRDDRWGRTYEGYAEDPEVVRSYAGAMTLGLQGKLEPGKPLAPGRVAATAKHFVADGGTQDGIDRGNAKIDDATLIRLHAAGYPPAIEAGALSVMVSYSSWNGAKMHGNRSLLTDVLKGRMGFQGFVVGDWDGHAYVPGCTKESCPAAINAGLDMFMAPGSWKPLFENTLAQVRSGEIPIARLDDAVRRILRVKVKLGLFDPVRPAEGRLDVLASPEHRALAREAVRKSLVLLKNEGVLPIRANARVLVTGDGADNIGKQAGGWTITWQGTDTTNADFPNAQSIWEGLNEAVTAGGGAAELSLDGTWQGSRPDVAIVVFGENPYAEMQGDRSDLMYRDPASLTMLRALKAAGIRTVAVFLSGRPLWANRHLNQSDAFVAAWLPGSEGGGIADVLVGDPVGMPRRDFTGRLSFSWPKDGRAALLNVGDADYDPLFAYGYGLHYGMPGALPRLPEEPGVPEVAAALDRLFVDGRSSPPWQLDIPEDLSVRRTDRVLQEDALSIEWTAPAAILIQGPPADLSRQAGADMVLSFRYRLDAPVVVPPVLGMRSVAGMLERPMRAMSQAKPGEWQQANIKLSCFVDAGLDATAITAPFVLRARAGTRLTLSDIRIAPNPGDGACP